jgi:hypothetical protein
VDLLAFVAEHPPRGPEVTTAAVNRGSAFAIGFDDKVDEAA